jgi:hypothetical protein
MMKTQQPCSNTKTRQAAGGHSQHKAPSDHLALPSLARSPATRKAQEMFAAARVLAVTGPAEVIITLPFQPAGI